MKIKSKINQTYKTPELCWPKWRNLSEFRLLLNWQQFTWKCVLFNIVDDMKKKVLFYVPVTEVTQTENKKNYTQQRSMCAVMFGEQKSFFSVISSHKTLTLEFS